MNKKVFMFSGQGSQYYQMGKKLYLTHAPFREHMRQTNRFFKRELGVSALDTLYDNAYAKSEPFDDLLLSSLCLFMVEDALYQVVTEEIGEPDLLLGVSLGEFISTALSNPANRENMIYALCASMTNVRDHCPGGSMISILAPPGIWHEDPLLKRYTEIAAVNFDQHFVITVPESIKAGIIRHLNQKEIYCQPLPVKNPFHSSLMDIVEAGCKEKIDGIVFADNIIPVMSCTACRIKQTFTGSFMWDVIRKPIRFMDTVQRMEAQGSYDYIDLGPSGTLATFVKSNLAPGSGSRSFRVLNPLGNEISHLKNIIRAFSSPSYA